VEYISLLIHFVCHISVQIHFTFFFNLCLSLKMLTSCQPGKFCSTASAGLSLLHLIGQWWRWPVEGIYKLMCAAELLYGPDFMHMH